MVLPTRHGNDEQENKVMARFDRLKRSLRLVPLLFVAALLFGGLYTVETGNVAVEKTLGRVDLDEIGEGLHWRLPFVTQVTEYSAKTITLDLLNMAPKAQDNLTLEGLDVSFFYRVQPHQIAEMTVKYASSAQRDGSDWLPLYAVVYREARSIVYGETSRIPSLELHRQREKLANAIAESLARRLDAQDPGVVTIERVVIRDLKTDRSIEQSIQLAVQNQKKLEAKQVEVEIAAKDAEIEIKRAQGLAEANRIINQSLTAEYLQHEVNEALKLYGANGCPATVIPANMQGAQLLLNTAAPGKP